MLRDDVINKIMVEMGAHAMFDIKQETWVRGYLEMAYGAGFDEGRLLRAHRKRVCKMDNSGTVLSTYESPAVAARLHGISPEGIYDTIAGKQHTAGGYYWKYEQSNTKRRGNKTKKRRTAKRSGKSKTGARKR